MAKHIQADIPNDDFRIMEKWIDAAFRRGSRLPAGLVSSTMHEAMRMCVHADSRPRKFSQPPAILKCRNQTVSLTKAQWASWFGVFHNAWSYAHVYSRRFKTAQVLATIGDSQVQKSETVSLTKAQWKTGGKWQLPGVENNNCKVACAWAATDSTSTF